MSYRVLPPGSRFGRLLVLAEGPLLPRKGESPIHSWRCLCDCGTEITVPTVRLVAKQTKSCGCLKRDRSRETMYALHKKRRLLAKRKLLLSEANRPIVYATPPQERSK